ncbi:MAG: reverse transcriptase/maturase family protein [Candidatus Azambacteria bacterium]|nr:reverse transcriptase/maturase family protein [Candidatus Azambacteria bacterium]
MKIQLSHNFEYIVSIDNLLEAWKEFIRGKRNKKDVQEFSLRLMDNIITLHQDLNNHTYRHGGYQAFNISDPKPRNIHKASVRDRLLHHAMYRILYPFFDKTFISDSYSCRLGKGTHKALNRFKYFAGKVSKNNSRTCWVLKCDIRKFFANIDHKILLDILNSYISDKKIIWLLKEIIESFYSTNPGVGLPLGNLTSQLFVSIYMNEFDQFVKHRLKVKYYIRYADDFVILSNNKQELENLIFQISDFLSEKLKLQLHPDKVFIKTLNSGINFLGWVNFPYHRVLRTATKRRMFRRIQVSPTPEILNSYFGLLGHGNAGKLERKIYKEYLRYSG